MTGTPQPAATFPRPTHPPKPAAPENLAAGEPDLWLTAVLRPAGRLAGVAVDRLVDSLTALAGSASLVVVDLAAATIEDPEEFAQALRLPGGLLSGADRCLLLVGADRPLLAALDRSGAQIATLDAPR